jgi:hypothetical protein
MGRNQANLAANGQLGRSLDHSLTSSCMPNKLHTRRTIPWVTHAKTRNQAKAILSGIGALLSCYSGAIFEL